jgi:hypothetical protein
MSILAQKLDEVRTAATIAKKLSPAMVRVMTAPSVTDQDGIWPREWVVANETSPGSLTVYAKVNTTVALMQRELLAAGRYNEAGNVGHDFTDLGLLVRDVLVRGAEVLLAETREKYAEQEAQGHGYARSWRWTVTGTACARSTMLRDFKDSGELVAESLGAAMIALCDHGPFWGLVDERSSRVTFTFDPVAQHEPMRQQPQQQQQAQDVPETSTRDLFDPGLAHLAYLMPAHFRTVLLSAHFSVGATVVSDRPSALKALERAGIATRSRDGATVDTLTELGTDVHRAVTRLGQLGVLSTRRTPLRHQLLAQVVADDFETVALVDDHRRLFRGARKFRSFFLRSHETKGLTDLLVAGLIQSTARRQNPNGPAPVRLTEAGMLCLMVWDAAHERRDLPEVAASMDPAHHGLAITPPHDVLIAIPTKEVVAKYPEYYIMGPGRVIADRVLCEHDYHLTDSCPCCP